MRLFISYAHEDHQAVAEIVGILKGEGGHEVWWDRDLLPGDDWLAGLTKEIRASDALVYVLSPPAVASTWCHWELGQAAALVRPVSTVLLSDCEIPEVVRRIQYADWRGGPTNDAKADLLDGLAKAERIRAGYAQEVAEPVGVPPGALPKGSRMPYSRNPLFTGREEDLQRLERALDPTRVRGTVVVGQAALTGMGGIGKTQLAAEYVYRYGFRFIGGVQWLNFGSPEGINNEVAKCGLAMGLFDEITDEPKQVKLVRRVWSEPTKRLLVFDNLDDDNAEELLDEWRPKGSGAFVLVTSRRDQWEAGLGVSKVSLGVLDREESIALLWKYRPDLDEALAAELAEELGDLPLALDLAGSYLKRYERSVRPDAYLETLRKPGLLEHPSMVGFRRSYSPTKHELNVGRTFAVSYERLETNEEIDPMARALLFRAAYFAPGEAIPRVLLAQTTEGEGVGSEDVEDGLMRLGELGLVTEEEDGSIWMHRLVAAFVLGAATEEGTAGEALAAVEEVVDSEASRINSAGFPGPLLAWQGHLRHVAEAAAKRQDKMAGRLLNNLGYHLDMIADYNGARPYYEQALAIRQKALGPEHPDTAGSLNNLGALLDSIGEYEAARPYYEQALAIRQKALGPEHPATARSLNNLGALLQAMGEYEAARPYYEQALVINEKALGPEHPDTAQSLNNLGALLDSIGEYEAARPYYEQALAIRQKALGPEHPDTAQSLNNLGALLDSMGEYEAARPYYEQALAIRQKALGPEHPDTAGSLNNLGALLDSMGDYDGARPYYEQALAINEKALGPEHPDTAQSLNNLGGLLKTMGDYEAARPYYEQALAIRQKALGPEHPDTAGSLNNLGALLQAMGDYEAARPYFEQALAIRQKALVGPEHPDTALSLWWVGSIMEREGKNDEARANYQNALAIFETKLGPEHDYAINLRGHLKRLEG